MYIKNKTNDSAITFLEMLMAVQLLNNNIDDSKLTFLEMTYITIARYH